MADQSQKGGLPSISANADANNLPLYGESDEDMQNLQNAQQKVSDALEHRYDNPNWFNVAAGFAKPQLGGFLASLGSASEAMGQNQEEQRNNVLQSSDLKLKLLQNQMMLGANKKAADQMQQWHTDNPGALAMPPEVLSEFSKGATNSPLIAKEQQNYNDQINRAKELQSAGGNLSPAQMNLLKGTSTSQPQQTDSSTQPSAPIGQAKFDLNKSSPEQLAQLAKTPGFDQSALVRGVKNFEGQNTQDNQPQKPAPTIYPPSIPPLNDKSTFGQVNSKAMVDAHNTMVNEMEQPLRDQYSSAASIAAGPNYTPENAARTNLIQLIQSNPGLTQKISGLVRSSPVLASVDEGANATAAGAHVNFALPISTALDANLSDPEKAFKDKLINLVNQVSQSDAKLNGTVAGKVPQQEYMKSFGSYINDHMSPATLENAAKLSKVNLDQKRDWYNQMTDELGKNVSPDSQTPFTDVNKNSHTIQNISKKYTGVNNLLQQELQNKIKPNGATP